jgi:DNA-damage-inducible protein J
MTEHSNERAFPVARTINAVAHDAWFRAKVQVALSDPRPAIPHKKVEAHFTKRRAAARAREIIHAVEAEE